MKKIICLGMAVAMMAALAIPASAAQATNSTVVHFAYKTDKNGPDAGNEDNLYHITIPAHIELDVTGSVDDKAGATFKGEGTIALDGVIGQDSKVVISVESENDYTLKSDSYTTTAKYTMTPTSSSAGITIAKDLVFKNGTTTKVMADATAVAFSKEGKITLDFANDGDTGIFGKCDLSDTLTFTYTYDDEDGAGDGGNTFKLDTTTCTADYPKSADEDE